MTPIHWINLFVDVNRRDLDAAVDFWCQTLDLTASAKRGQNQEFVTLLPATGASWLRVQGIETEDSRVHLDFSVDDVDAATAEAVSLGATLVRVEDDEKVLTSPAGIPFCFTSQKPDADGVQHRDVDALMDQACLDIPSPQYAAEVDFWHQLTGWDVVDSVVPEFCSLQRPDAIPVRITFQQTAEGHAKAHPDIAALRRPVEVRKHEACGAAVFDVQQRWTVMVGVLGLRYCITERKPQTGLL